MWLWGRKRPEYWPGLASWERCQLAWVRQTRGTRCQQNTWQTLSWAETAERLRRQAGCPEHKFYQAFMLQEWSLCANRKCFCANEMTFPEEYSWKFPLNRDVLVSGWNIHKIRPGPGCFDQSTPELRWELWSQNYVDIRSDTAAANHWEQAETVRHTWRGDSLCESGMLWTQNNFTFLNVLLRCK